MVLRIFFRITFSPSMVLSEKLSGPSVSIFMNIPPPPRKIKMQPHFIFDFKVLFSNFIEKVLMICIYMLCYCSPAKENTVQCMEL